MTLKIDLLFQQSTNKAGGSEDQVRVAGWSEGWYTDLSITSARAAVDTLAGARSALLTSSAAIVGQRYRVVGGGSSTDNKIFPGSNPTLSDLPSIGLLCTVAAVGAPNVRRFALRGIPDARAVEGEYVPSSGFTTALSNFGDVLGNGNWKFKGRVLTNPKVEILSIAVDGTVISKSAIALAAGDKVRLLNVRDDNGANQSGQYIVDTWTNGTHWKILGYEGAIAHRGFARLDETFNFTVLLGSFERGRVVTHKVGRPFFQFRGRRSTRR